MTAPGELPCFGCSAPVDVDPRYYRRRAWCENCAPFSPHFYTLTAAGRILERYELTDAAKAIEAAMESMREQIRTGAAPASAIAAEARRKEGEAKRGREAWERSEVAQGKLYSLRPDLAPCLVNAHLFAEFREVRTWPVLHGYLESTVGDETPEELLEGARDRLRAAAREDPRLWVAPVQLHPARPRRRRTA